MPSAAASDPSATSTRLAVAPARSSLATERVMPSSARQAARWAGEAAVAGLRPMTTTRAQRPSRFRAGASVARSDSRSAGPWAAVRSTTTPPRRPASGTSSTSVAPAAASASRSAVSAGVPAWPPTSTGPSTSGRPGTWRRSATGWGRPSVVASFLPTPEETNAV